MLNKLLIQKISILGSDLLSMFLAFICAINLTLFYHHDITTAAWHAFFHPGASKFLGLGVLVVFWSQEQYIKRRPFWEELLHIYRIIGFFIIINLGISFVMAKGSLKVLIIGFWLSFALILPMLRTLSKHLLSRLGLWQRDLFILGYNGTAMEAYKLFACNKLMGYQLKAFVDPLSQAGNNQLAHLPAPLIGVEEFKTILNLNPQCEIIVALTNAELNQQIGLINYLQHNCLAVLVLPEISGLALYGAQIEHFFGNDQLVLRLNNNLAQFSNTFIKRLFDIGCVLCGLLILTPVFIFIALLIKSNSGCNVFYLHRRIGKHGKPFYCIKFQTMYPNSAELLVDLLANNPDAWAEWQKGYKLKNDPRVTKIGAWLRKTSLDELPQLFNVLKGEMSLVGPRPIVVEEIERYKEGFYYYQLVTPGVSGLWQVSGRNDIDYTNRVRLDEWYVKNWSLWYDVVILIKTIGVVIKRSGAY